MDVVLPPSSGPGYSVIRNLSSSSLHSIASILSTASDSLLPGLDPDEVEVVREDGVRHSKNLLEARCVCYLLYRFLYMSHCVQEIQETRVRYQAA